MDNDGIWYIQDNRIENIVTQEQISIGHSNFAETLNTDGPTHDKTSRLKGQRSQGHATR